MPCIIFSSDSYPSMMQLSATVSTGMEPGRDAILEPEQEFIERHGLVVAHSLARNVDGRILVQLLNPSPAPVTVRKSEKVGLLQSLEDACTDVCALRELGSGTPESNAHRKSRDEVIKQLLSNVHDLSHLEIKQLESLLSEFSDVISTGEDDLGKTKLLYHDWRCSANLAISQETPLSSKRRGTSTSI